MLSEASDSLRPPGAKILQRCVVAIDSGDCAALTHPRGLSLPCSKHVARYLFLSSSLGTFLLHPYLSLSSSIFRAASLPRSSLISEISQSLLLTASAYTDPKGLKLFPTSSCFRVRSNDETSFVTMKSRENRI